MATVWRSSCLSVVLACSALAVFAPYVHAQDADMFELSPLTPSPVSREMNQHYYERLRKDPWRALGWETLFPGAGSAYTGLHGNAILTLSVSVLGAGLWTAGAIWDQDALWWAGAGTFVAGRTYGLIAAPVGALLLNAAFRRQLGVAQRF